MNNYTKAFWKSVDNIQRVIGLDDNSLSGLFRLSPQEFSNIKQANKTPEIDSVISFTSRLNISMDSLFNNSIDYTRVQNSYFGNSLSLPSKYNYAKLSKSRNLINLLDYVEVTYSEQTRLALLDSLQIDTEFFSDGDRDINIHAIVDLCKKLEVLGFSNENYLTMGRYSYNVNKNNKLGAALSSYKNVHDLLEDGCENLSPMYDKNFIYKVIKKTNHSVIIESQLSEETIDAHKTKDLLIESTCLTKQGVFSSLPCYIGMDYAMVKKRKCIMLGDNSTMYELMLP